MKTLRPSLLTVVGSAAALVLAGCADDSPKKPSHAPGLPAASADYWHKGKAEISRFDLEQVRYGQVHRGHAVLIFVKEEFLPVKQVKYEGGPVQEKPVTVLKHISAREFATGMYPYTVMTSTFSPFASDQLSPYKVTATTQDWCGQTFMQVNHRVQEIDVQYNSYFQDEADQRLSMPPGLFEDGLWNVIRSDPSRLPVGQIEFLPSLHCVQLRLKDFKPHVAIASLRGDLDPSLLADSVLIYTLTYQDVPRTFSVTFESRWPHRILAWEETEDKLEGRSGAADPPLRTRAVRTHTILDDYWNHSSPADSTRRTLLGLF